MFVIKIFLNNDFVKNALTKNYFLAEIFQHIFLLISLMLKNSDISYSSRWLIEELVSGYTKVLIHTWDTINRYIFSKHILFILHLQ